MTILLVIIYILVCLFLVMVVLLQQGSGADLAGAFGGGGTQASFGPRSSTNIMHRMTTASFVLFVVLSLALAILSGKSRKSVMDAVEKPAPAAKVEVETGGTDGSSMNAPEEKTEENKEALPAAQPAEGMEGPAVEEETDAPAAAAATADSPEEENQEGGAKPDPNQG